MLRHPPLSPGQQQVRPSAALSASAQALAARDGRPGASDEPCSLVCGRFPVGKEWVYCPFLLTWTFTPGPQRRGP